MVTAGFHKVDITPPPGAPLAGFAARQGVSTGVHDPLFARALVLGRDGRVVAFVSVDVLGLGADFVARVRERITQETGVPGDAVMISATHTHAGPVTISTFFNPGESLDGGYMERLAAALAEAVRVARKGWQPARIGVGSGRVSGIGVNRRTADGRPVDEEVGIIKVDTPDGRTRGALINYACHPTVLGPDNLLVSGDFPAFAVDRIEQRLGDGGFAMFANGAQGNISMGHSSELSAIGVITPGRTFERAAALGHRLGDAAMEALANVATRTDPVLAVAQESLDLRFNTYPAPTEAAAALRAAESELAQIEVAGAPAEAGGKAKTKRLYASIRHFYSVEAKAAGGRLSIEIQAVRVGDALFVAVPAEVFAEIGLRLKRNAAHPLFLMGITNGYFGYLPTREAHQAGGYEVVSAKASEESEDLLVAKVHEMERRLFAGAVPS